MVRRLEKLANQRNVLHDLLDEKNSKLITLAAKKLSEIQERMKQYDLKEILIADFEHDFCDVEGEKIYILPHHLCREGYIPFKTSEDDPETDIYKDNESFIGDFFCDDLYKDTNFDATQISDMIKFAETNLEKAIHEKTQDMYELGLPKPPKPNFSDFFAYMDVYPKFGKTLDGIDALGAWDV